MKRILFIICNCFAAFIQFEGGSTAHATIVIGEVTGGTALDLGGTFVKLTPPLPNPFGPPNSVGRNNFQSPNLFGFDEIQNFVLTAPLQVNVGASPLPAGTIVSSHYVFFDPVLAIPNTSITGTVTFDSDVLGIITSRRDLEDSDFLANPDVNYLDPFGRGLEPNDSVAIIGARQISVAFIASSPGDYIRVLTAFSPSVVPEPGSLLLVGMGLTASGAWLLARKSESHLDR